MIFNLEVCICREIYRYINTPSPLGRDERIAPRHTIARSIQTPILTSLENEATTTQTITETIRRLN